VSANFATLVADGEVHRRFYTDPAVFDAEQTKVWGGTWVYVAHESEVPDPDDFVTAHLGSRPVIVTRGADRELRVLLNRCAHRGSTVCVEASGTAKRFACPYHGWTFANSGELLAVPYPSGYQTSRARSLHGLAVVPRVESYRGFVFATLNEDAVSLRDYLGAAAERLDDFIDRLPGGKLRVLPYAHRMKYAGNWKLMWDNTSDGVHPAFAHRSFLHAAAARTEDPTMLSQFARDLDRTGMYMEDLGHGHIFLDQRPGLAGSHWEAQRPVPGLETYERALREQLGDGADALLEIAPSSAINLSIFPNLLILQNQLQIVQPLAVDRTTLSFYLCVPEDVPGDLAPLRARIAEDFPNLVSPDDLEIFERCQDGLGIPELEWVDASRGLGSDLEVDVDGITRAPVTYETGVRAYQREWARLMAEDVQPRVAWAPARVSS
jgi:phenylpropionate dioxygenase-like ring-hydroxylating dioxygenase large terminal subunit